MRFGTGLTMFRGFGRMKMKPFAMAPTPALIFGAGAFARLPDILSLKKGQTLLLIRSGSFASHRSCQELLERLESAGIHTAEAVVRTEPSPELVDAICSVHRRFEISLVLGVGGGSVLDTAKAVAAMMTVDDSVLHYLEGVGTKAHPGTRLPLVLCPTTAGTGSEATKNAVLSRTGENGFKRSLRHEQFVPDLAVVDPALMISCPISVAGSTGMDALTQLIEAFLSEKANPVTDSLCLPAIAAMVPQLERMAAEWEDASKPAARLEIMEVMAYGAYLSGVALANAGLGTVHGYASSVGGVILAPHGVVCGTLLPPVLAAIIEEVASDPFRHEATRARLAGLAETCGCASALVFSERITRLARLLGLGSLASHGLEPEMCGRLGEQTSDKESPIRLSAAQKKEILLGVCLPVDHSR